MVENSLNLSSSLEDYLESIYNLSENGRVARSKDIAELLSVSQASVTGALRTLSDRKLVNYRPYGYITLTEKGRKAASGIARKHKIIKSFFVDILGVDDSVAQKAACRAEHAFGSEIVARLLSFTRFITSDNKCGTDIADKFKRFYKEHRKNISDKAIRPLEQVPSQTLVRLVSIDAGQELKQRLAEMGLFPDCRLLVMMNENGGQVIVNVKNSKVVLGRGMSNKIMVELL